MNLLWINRQKEMGYIEKISNKIEVNYVTGSELIAFRDALKPVYQYFEDKGVLTLGEIQEARKVAAGNSANP